MHSAHLVNLGRNTEHKHTVVVCRKTSQSTFNLHYNTFLLPPILCKDGMSLYDKGCLFDGG